MNRMMSLRSHARAWWTRGLVATGRYASPNLTRLLNGATNFLDTGRMLRQAKIRTPPPLRNRFEVFDVAIARAQVAARPVYLEFGVWEGQSIGYWASRLEIPNARFVGFDSFEGLPETWTTAAGRGAFSTTGRVPAVTDPRVSFEKGWFSDTLPEYIVPHHDLLIVNIDCDLYSSASTVLEAIGPMLQVGDLLYFDEFHDRLHEGRAFHEFRTHTCYSFDCLAQTAGTTHVLFRRRS